MNPKALSPNEKININRGMDNRSISKPIAGNLRNMKLI